MKNIKATDGKTPGWKLSILLYVLVWLTCVLWFWLGMEGGGWIMAYTILSFGVLLPATTLVVAFLLEWRRDLKLWRWAAMGFFGFMYATALWTTLVLSTFLGVTNIAAPSVYTFLVGLCSGAVGIALGWSVRNKKLNVEVPVIGLFILLVVCYVILKTINGSFFRPVLLLDVPAVAILLMFGSWLHRKIRQRRKRLNRDP